MVSRVVVRCPGCDELITLRLSVGPSEIQPFYYVCGNCNAATRGKIHVLFPELRLELEAGEQVTSTADTAQVITIDANIPSNSAARNMMDYGGSPFLHLTMALGTEGAARLGERNVQFRHLVKNDWLDLKRLVRYYLDRNWPMFDRSLERFKKDHGATRPWHRHDAIHKLADAFTATVWVRDTYPQMKAEWNATLHPQGAHGQAIRDYCKKISEDPGVTELQEQLFDCFASFVEHHDAIMPGFIMESLPEPWDQHGDLRVQRDDFATLRDLYIQVFETCHNNLPVLVELINVAKRGLPEAYLHPSDVRHPPTTRKHFQKLTSSDRAKYLAEMPVWAASWSFCLDRGLRNYIGHRKIRHDLRSGTLAVVGEPPVPYAVFLAMTHRLLYPLLATMNAIKLPLVFADLTEEGA